MSYLRFDKTTMINLEESLPREILRTNESGAYHLSTVVGCNTRKYHGLLVTPIPEMDDENHVLLSSLDETVIQHGAEFNLGLHKYDGNHFAPNGHKYIRDFDCETIPSTLYRVGGVILRKEMVFQHHECRVLLRYTLVDAHSQTTLRLRPFLAFRSVREYTHENMHACRDYSEVTNGIKTSMYPGYPMLYMQLNKQNEFVFKPDWYRGIEYTKEQERGYDFNEDLYVPGYFEFDIKKGESVVFAAGLEQVNTRTLKTLFQAEVEHRTPRDSFYHCLKNSAHQFLCSQKDETYLLAGYPWFKCRARDMFVSLPGLTLAIGREDRFKQVMATATKAVREFMAGVPLSVKVYEMEHPDVLLWAVWTIQQYAKHTSIEKCLEEYGDLVFSIIEYMSGKHDNVELHENGLLYADGREKAITWMNSTSGGYPIIPRSGYIVEVNALWYNALMFASELKVALGRQAEAMTIELQAKRTAASFEKVFLNEFGYLMDYVDGANADYSVRPNMVFALAFDYSPLTRSQSRKVLSYVTKELLTPKGLRSLSPKSSGYNPFYVGTTAQRDQAYHQGTAWPWLLGFYTDAYLKLYKSAGVSFAENTLVGVEDEMTTHCIGTLPELCDGNPPFTGRGAVSFAMNVAEILRIIRKLEKYNYNEERSIL